MARPLVEWHIAAPGARPLRSLHDGLRCLVINLQEPHGQRRPPAAVIDSTRHRSTPWIDTTSPTPPRHPLRRALVLRVITVLGGPGHRTRPSSPPTVGQDGLREGLPALPGSRAAQGHGHTTRYTTHRPSNTRPAPPTTGSSSLDQGVGRSVWVGISAFVARGRAPSPARNIGLYYYDRLERREVASKCSGHPGDVRRHGHHSSVPIAA